MNARQPFCWWMTFTKVSNPFLPSPHKWLTWPLDVCGGVGYGWFYWFSLKIFFQTSPELETFQRDWNNDVVFFFSSTLSIMSDIFFQCRIFQFFPGLFWQNDLEQRNSVRIYFHPPIGHNRSFKKAENTNSSITVTVIDEFVFSPSNDPLFSMVVIWLIMIDHVATLIVLGFCSGLKTLCI